MAVSSIISQCLIFSYLLIPVAFAKQPMRSITELALISALMEPNLLQEALASPYCAPLALI